MKTVDSLVLTFLLNALWQVAALTVVASLCDRLLLRGPARYRHALWIAVIAASVLLPALSLLGRSPGATAGASPLPAAALAVPTADTGAVAPDRTPPVWKQARFPSRLAWAVILVYGASMVAHAARLVRAWVWTDRLARDAEPVEVPERSSRIVERCRQAFGLGPVEILESSRIDGPVTMGALRPAILLPPAFLEASPDDQVTATLGHEMAHIRRRDYAVNLLCEVILLPIAFHPATRWLRRRLAESREMACDEATVERLLGARAYARSLLSLAASLAGLSRPAASTPAGRSRPAHILGALDAGILEVRMKRLTDHGPRPGARRARASFAAAALILGAAGLFAAGLSLEASASSGGLSPFVGVWKAEYALNPGDKPRLWIQMEIRDAGGRPAVDLAFFRNRRQDDGSVRTDQVKTEMSDLKVTGNVLRFRTRGEFQYRDGQPRETVEFDHVFELAGSGEATLRQTWSSLEGRQDAPPPPPAPAVLRRAD